MHVASGMPASLKELLAKKCQERGMADFATTVLSQELLVDSDAQAEGENVDPEAGSIWVSHCNASCPLANQELNAGLG